MALPTLPEAQARSSAPAAPRGLCPSLCLSTVFALEPAKLPSASSGEEADAGGLLPTPDELSQALAGSDSLDSPPRPLERCAGQLPSPPLLPTPPPKASCKAAKTIPGRSVLCCLLPPSLPSFPFSSSTLLSLGCPAGIPTLGWFSPLCSVPGVLGSMALGETPR